MTRSALAGASLAGVVLAAALLLAGPAAAQLPALQDRPLSAAERVKLASLESRFARISQERNTSVAAVRAIARALGPKLATAEPDALVKLIDERAGSLSKAKARIAELETQLESSDSVRLMKAVAPLLVQAREAIDAGALETADARLAEAASRFGDARKGLQAQADQIGVQEASVLAERAAVRAAVFDEKGAAALYAQAAEAMPAAYPRKRYMHRKMQALSLGSASRDTGDQSLRHQALEVLRTKALPLVAKGEWPAAEAETEANIGHQLVQLGKAKGDIPMVADGVAHLRAGVAAAPAEPAMLKPRITASLANALVELAFLRKDKALSDEALALIRKAHAEEPLKDGAEALRYADVLATVYKNGAGETVAEEAIAAYDDAQAKADPVKEALMIAVIRINRAGTLQDMAGRAAALGGAGTAAAVALLRRAVADGKAAIAGLDRSTHPAIWTPAVEQTGIVLLSQAKLQGAEGLKAADEGAALLAQLADGAASNDPLTVDRARNGIAEAAMLHGEHDPDPAARAAGLAKAEGVYREMAAKTTGANAVTWPYATFNLAEVRVKQAMAAATPAARTAALDEADALYAKAAAAKVADPELDAGIAKGRQAAAAARKTG